MTRGGKGEVRRRGWGERWVRGRGRGKGGQVRGSGGGRDGVNCGVGEREREDCIVTLMTVARC